MTKRGLALALFVGVLSAALGIGVLWNLLQKKAEPTIAPSLRVPVEFRQVREAFGHEVHLKKGVRCSRCHDLATGDFTKQKPDACVSCHEKQTAHGGPHAPNAPKCTACHDFAGHNVPAPSLAASEENGVAYCLRCHDKAIGATPAVTHHAEARCVDCHSPHGEPTSKVRPCVECHEDQATHHPTVPAEQIQTLSAQAAGLADDSTRACLGCHQMHADKELAETSCTTCHQTQSGTALVAHDACTSCHAPHEFAPRDCKSCHGELHVLAFNANAHTACTNCHEPHAASASSAESRCTSCHSTLHPTHPAVDEHTCTSCHNPHPEEARGPVAQACTNCHHEAPTNGPWHSHADNVGCTSCHAPHNFALEAKPTLCATCHADKVTLTSHAQGHSNCTQCHSSAAHHPESTPAPCATCHETQAASMHGAHAECTNCHEPHSGDLNVGRCSQCHEEQAHSMHAPPNVACTSCHDPHSRAPLAVNCNSCHQRSTLSGLHQQPAHSTCTSCHEAHSAPQGSRSTCVACHTDRVNHQPDATSCTGCHVFR